MTELALGHNNNAGGQKPIFAQVYAPAHIEAEVAS